MMNRRTMKVSLGVLCAVFTIVIAFAMAFALAPNTSAAHAETEYTVVWDKEVLKTFPEYKKNQQLASRTDTTCVIVPTGKDQIAVGYIVRQGRADTFFVLSQISAVDCSAHRIERQ